MLQLPLQSAWAVVAEGLYVALLSWEWDRVRRAGNVSEPQKIRGGRTLREHLESRTCPGPPGWLGAEFGVSAPLISLFPLSPKKLLSDLPRAQSACPCT